MTEEIAHADPGLRRPARIEERAVQSGRGQEQRGLRRLGDAEQHAFAAVGAAQHEPAVRDPGARAGAPALPQHAHLADATKPRGQRGALVPPLRVLGRPRGAALAVGGEGVDRSGAPRLEERAEGGGAHQRERLQAQAAQLSAERRYHPRGHADRDVVVTDHDEARAIGAGIERGGEIGAGRVEEIAPRSRERCGEATLGVGEREVDVRSGHGPLTVPPLTVPPLTLPSPQRGEGGVSGGDLGWGRGRRAGPRRRRPGARGRRRARRPARPCAGASPRRSGAAPRWSA